MDNLNRNKNVETIPLSQKTLTVHTPRLKKRKEFKKRFVMKQPNVMIKNSYNFVYNPNSIELIPFKRYCLVFISELSVGLIYRNCRTFLYLNIKTNHYYVSIIDPIQISNTNEYVGTAVLYSKRRKILYYTLFDIGLHVNLAYMIDMFTHTICVCGETTQICIPF